MFIIRVNKRGENAGLPYEISSWAEFADAQREADRYKACGYRIAQVESTTQPGEVHYASDAQQPQLLRSARREMDESDFPDKRESLHQRHPA